MATHVQPKMGGAAKVSRRRHIRFAGAALATVTAIMYLLVGFNLVTVVELAPGEVSGQAAFGLPAALAYALGAVLLVTSKRRIFWILGALLQLFVIFMYFSVAPQRTPSFEVWGILIRVAQILLLGVLLYLVFRPEQDGGAA